MIVDNLDRCELYYSLNKGFEKAFKFINNYLKRPVKDGRYEIDGDSVYALVMDCDLKETGRLETHNKYIDIQFVVSGEEQIGVADRSLLDVSEDNSEAKDVIFYNSSDSKYNIKLRSGDFAVFLPHDAHEPCLILNECKKATKIVVKVKV